jgi:hypothetical protein
MIRGNSIGVAGRLKGHEDIISLGQGEVSRLRRERSALYIHELSVLPGLRPRYLIIPTDLIIQFTKVKARAALIIICEIIRMFVIDDADKSSWYAIPTNIYL